MVREIKDFLKSIKRMWEHNDDGKIVKFKRAKDKKGRFIADDKTTEKNEAWIGGKSPK